MVTSAEPPTGSKEMGRRASVLVRLGEGGPVLADPRSPFLRADDMGALRGDGVFERFLVIAGRPRHFEDHLARLVRSAGQLELVVPGEPAWRAAVEAGIAAWQGHQQWEMRLVCTRGPEEGAAPPLMSLARN